MKTILDIISIVLFYITVSFWLGIGILLLPAIIPTLLIIILMDTIQNKKQ